MPLVIALHHADGLARDLAAHGIRIADNGCRAALIGIASDSELEVVATTVRSRPDLPVMAIVPRDDSGETALRALRAIELGACALMPADATVERCAHAIGELVARRIVVDAFALEILIRGLQVRAQAHTRYAITSREREVLCLLVEGHTAPSMATTLGISVATVQTHLKSLYRKLDVDSKAAATAVALRNHLV